MWKRQQKSGQDDKQHAVCDELNMSAQREAWAKRLAAAPADKATPPATSAGATKTGDSRSAAAGGVKLSGRPDSLAPRDTGWHVAG